MKVQLNLCFTVTVLNGRFIVEIREVVTGRNEVVAKVIFLQVSVRRGGRVSASVHAGMPCPPQMENPPWMENPPDGEPPPPGSRL